MKVKLLLLRILCKIINKKVDRSILLRLLPKNSICAEIGVWKADFSQQIIRLSNPKKLYLIDPWKFQPTYSDEWYGGGKAARQDDMDNIYDKVREKFEKNDDVEIIRDFSEAACNSFKKEFFDWIYIDGNHSYEFVKKDLEAYLPKVKKGAYILGDDYYWGEGYPVKKAVDEFVSSGKAKKITIFRGQFLFEPCYNRTHSKWE